MSSSQIILQARGKEDGYLTKDANHSYFRFSKSDYTYFSQNWNIVYPTQNYKFDDSQCTTIRLPLEGDLISKMMLRLNINDPAITTDASGKLYALNLLESVSFKYNNQTISTLDYNYIALHHKLHSSNNEYEQFLDMTSLTPESGDNEYSNINQDSKANTLFIPLPFWFTKNPGSSFPLWLLNKPQLIIEIKLRKNTPTLKNLDLLVQYTNLTTKEKDVFTNSSLEYLIEQVEIVNKVDFVDKTQVKIDLPRTKFVKYLVWNVLDTNATNNLYSTKCIEKTTLLLNGNPIINRIDKHRTALINRFNYFKTPYVTNKNFLISGADIYSKYSDTNDLNIHSHVFCLDTTTFQSSGFLTTDKYNNFTLEIDTLNVPKSGTMHTYLIKHNVLRFQNGVLNLLHN